jgi:hypothetical protein
MKRELEYHIDCKKSHLSYYRAYKGFNYSVRCVVKDIMESVGDIIYEGYYNELLRLKNLK